MERINLHQRTSRSCAVSYSMRPLITAARAKQTSKKPNKETFKPDDFDSATLWLDFKKSFSCLVPGSVGFWPGEKRDVHIFSLEK